MRSRMIGVISLLTAAGLALGQDSVAFAPGGNDSLSPHQVGTLRTRYVVDSAPLVSSWGQAFRIAPVLKATRDLDPMFRTQILGASAISNRFGSAPTTPSGPYAFWTAAGAGVHPSGNTPAGTLSPSSFVDEFAVAFVDHAIDATNLVVATVGRELPNRNRLYVTRTHALASRAAPGSPDTSTFALGSVTSAGRAFLRADAFTSQPATPERITGDNILQVNARGFAAGAVNTLFVSAGTNSASDPVNTTYIVRNDSAPYGTPGAADFDGASDRALIFDLRALYRSGASTASLSGTTSAHRPVGIAGQRGNPTFAPVTPLGGTLGTVAALAKPTAGGATAPVNTLAAFGVNSAGLTAPVAAGTPRAFALPAPISVPGFTANTGGNARFDQYKSQHVFRGGNGPVGLGLNGSGQLVLAAVATDPTAGDFVAVVTATGPATESWTVAARPGQSVLNGPNGSPIGALSTANLRLSAPAVDRLGNVYFAATWLPALQPERVGVFRAVNVDNAGTYRIEKLVSEGDAFAGANSGTPYTVSAIALRDSDSLASGAIHQSSLLQAQTPGHATSDPISPRSAGGLIVNATITYDRGGTPEAYETVLLITPELPSAPPPCPGDFNGDRTVDLLDLLAFNAAWSSNLGQAVPAGANGDFNGDSTVDLLDLLAFNAAWSSNLGVVCP